MYSELLINISKPSVIIDKNGHIIATNSSMEFVLGSKVNPGLDVISLLKKKIRT